MSLRTVQDHMRGNEVTPASIKISNNLRKLARGRYDDYREKSKLEKKDKSRQRFIEEKLLWWKMSKIIYQ